MASSGIDKGDDYRYYLHGEEEKNTKWRYGSPPNYEVVNKLFHEGRTKVLQLSLYVSVCVKTVGYWTYSHT